MNSTWLYIVCKSAIYRSIILLPLQSNDIVLIIQIFWLLFPTNVGMLGLQFVKEELYVRKNLPSQIVGNTQIVEITYKQKADNE